MDADLLGGKGAFEENSAISGAFGRLKNSC